MRADHRSARAAQVVAALAVEHVDALVVTSLPNIRWLTGFSGSNALLLVTPHERVLCTDFRYDTQAADEVGPSARVVIEAQSLWTALWRELGRLPALETVGFESAHLLHRDFARLLDPQQGGRWQWRPVTDAVEPHRAVKDADEVSDIVGACRMAEAALEATLAGIHPGMSELAICGVLEHALRDAGSETAPFEPIVASGPRSALPHARASDRVWGRGELLLLDFGARCRGYVSDMTRVVVAGPPDARQRDVHAVVAGANRAAAAAVRPGMTGRDADAVARRYIAEAGFGEAFGHSLGHGIGLEVHEAPRLAKTAEAPLPAGAVVTIEPGVYLPGWGGIRVEDDVVLTPGGATVLTRAPHDLLTVD
ncbi:MAG: aminopeptidase P family protein [Gemmatimonadaceae bacterium]|nr:aminopeptidase P family protein [Gemmatimonadaceae bacterium]